MEFPIRCFTCGAPIAQYYDEYIKMLEEGKTPKEALDKLGVKRYYSRRMFISHKEFDEIKQYKRL